MSARLPTTHPGTGSVEKPVKSYRALLSTDIRRRVPCLESTHGESKSLDSLTACEKRFLTSNNNKRTSLVNGTKAESERTVKKCCNPGQLIERKQNQGLLNLKPKVQSEEKPETMMPSQVLTLISDLPLTKVEPGSDLIDTSPSSAFSSSSNSVEMSTSSGLTTAQGLPSPASSTSETSDYQRSTPSPRSEQEPCNGSVDGWLSDSRCKNEDVDPGLGDEGFSESVPIPASIHCHQRTISGMPKCASLLEERLNSDPKICLVAPPNVKVFQQLRVALEKIPAKKLPILLTRPSSYEPCIVGAKRAKVLAEDLKVDLVKKLKLDSDDVISDVKLNKIESKERPTSLRANLNQGKITHYLTETKLQFNNAIRKHKLDKILNLIKTEPTPTSNLLPPELLPKIGTNFTVLTEPRSILVKNEIPSLDISSNDNSPNDSDNSSTRLSNRNSSKTNDDDTVFEIPQSIRFPVNRNNHFPSEAVFCKWASCGLEFESNGKLLDHLKTVHAVCHSHRRSDEAATQFKCYWEGCKVFGKGSSSKSWLEKHVTNHGGNKPFQCIVDGCHQRFSTQSLLERHVNNHFKSSSHTSGGVSGNNTGNGLTGISNSATGNGHSGGSEYYVRPIRKYANGRKVKYRRTIYSARIFDLFDIGVMTQVRQKLTDCETRCAHWRASGQLEASTSQSPLDQVVLFTSQVLAKRTDQDGQIQVLQHWTPENLIEDEWTLVHQVRPTKRVRVSSLPYASRIALVAHLFDKRIDSSDKVKRGRKTKPQPRSTAVS